MSLMRAAIWIATVLFVVMLFYPLVAEILVRLGAPAANGLP
jgi:hypothetical protein